MALGRLRATIALGCSDFGRLRATIALRPCDMGVQEALAGTNASANAKLDGDVIYNVPKLSIAAQQITMGLNRIYIF